MAATKNPILCSLAAPSWEDSKSTIEIRQSDLDEARAELARRTERLNADMRGEAYVSNTEHAVWGALDRYIGRIEEAINAQDQYDEHHRLGKYADADAREEAADAAWSALHGI